MRRTPIAAASIAALLLAACSDAPTSTSGLAPTTRPSLAALAQTVNTSFPFDIAVFIPCAAGGAGEIVQMSGELHDLFHVTISSSGQLTLKFHDQPQAVSGVGLATGDKYQATGVTQEQVHQNLVTGWPFTDTFVNNFRIIGQGPGNNFLVHEVVHVTVNANGTLTSFHDNASFECK